MVSPGEITKQNVKEYEKKYPYDEIMYFSDNKCITCKTLKFYFIY